MSMAAIDTAATKCAPICQDRFAINPSLAALPLAGHAYADSDDQTTVSSSFACSGSENRSQITDVGYDYIELFRSNNADDDFDDCDCYRRTCVYTPKWVIAHGTAIKILTCQRNRTSTSRVSSTLKSPTVPDGTPTLEAVSDANCGNIPDYGMSTSA